MFDLLETYAIPLIVICAFFAGYSIYNLLREIWQKLPSNSHVKKADAKAKKLPSTKKEAIKEILNKCKGDDFIILTFRDEKNEDEQNGHIVYNLLCDEKVNYVQHLHFAFFSFFPDMLELPQVLALYMYEMDLEDIRLNYDKQKIESAIRAIQATNYKAKEEVTDYLLEALPN